MHLSQRRFRRRGWQRCRKDGWRGSESYQISQRIQLLSHQTTLLSPPRDFAVHEVEKQAEGDEGQRDVDGAIGCRGAETVAHRGQDGHEAAEACRDVH